MSVGHAYAETLKRRAITSFVSTNKRAPTEEEVRELVRKVQEAYPNADQVGISGYDIVRPGFRAASSVADETVNRAAMLDDMDTLSTRIEGLARKLEDGFRGFYATSRQTFDMLDALEGRANTLLLVNGSSSLPFLAGAEEDFYTHEAIDFANTTAQVENGYVTLNRTNLSAMDLSLATIRASVVSAKGVLSSEVVEATDTLYQEDGRFWQYVANTSYAQGRVSLVLEVELDAPAYVGDLRLYLSALSVNKPLTATIFYSLDGNTFSAAEPAEQPVTQSEMQFAVGQAGVRKLQILLSKNAADASTASSRQWVYLWMLDTVKIFTDGYVANKSSELIAGPYEMKDAEGTPVMFTKASLSACTIEPTYTSADFYLSTDKATWLPIDHKGKGLDYVSFGTAGRGGHVAFHDAAVAAQGLVEQPGIFGLAFEDEAVLNAYIPQASVPLVTPKGLTLKRNYPGSEDELLQAVAGWVFNADTGQYATTVYIAEAVGRYIDFGPFPVSINGQTVSGRAFLPQGYSVVGVNDSNWQEIETTGLTADALRQQDSLYPYNHRYLIQGYTYGSSYTGERVYTGVSEYFGRLLRYVVPEAFDILTPSDSRYYNVFTFVDTSDRRYVKIKVDKSDSSWRDELVDSDWIVQTSADNKIYVRAVLQSSEAGLTPQIQSFKVTVI